MGSFIKKNSSKNSIGKLIIISILSVSTSSVLYPNDFESYHPLNENRIIIDRASSAKQMSYNVNKKLEGVADRFGDGDLDGALKNLSLMLDWNLSNYEKAVIYQFMGFVYVQQNDTNSAIDVFKKCIDLN